MISLLFFECVGLISAPFGKWFCQNCKGTHWLSNEYEQFVSDLYSVLSCILVFSNRTCLIKTQIFVNFSLFFGSAPTPGGFYAICFVMGKIYDPRGWGFWAYWALLVYHIPTLARGDRVGVSFDWYIIRFIPLSSSTRQLLDAKFSKFIGFSIPKWNMT